MSPQCGKCGNAELWSMDDSYCPCKTYVGAFEEGGVPCKQKFTETITESVAVAGVNGFSFGPTTEKSSAVDIPIESQKPPFQSEPFPGYIDTLKARIVELEATVQEACSFLTTASLYFSGDEWYLREIEKFVAKHDEVNQASFIEKYTKGMS